MHSLVKVLGNFKEYCQALNSATSTGAIDVIVVEQPNGEFLCSTFHVCFSMLGVLNSREKNVDIEINGMPVNLQMRLSDTGVAFFLEKSLESEETSIYTTNIMQQSVDYDKNNHYLLEHNESRLNDQRYGLGSVHSLNVIGHSAPPQLLLRSKSCSSIGDSYLRSWDFTQSENFDNLICGYDNKQYIKNTILMDLTTQKHFYRTKDLTKVQADKCNRNEAGADADNDTMAKFSKRNYFSDSEVDYTKKNSERKVFKVLSEGEVSSSQPNLILNGSALNSTCSVLNLNNDAIAESSIVASRSSNVSMLNACREVALVQQNSNLRRLMENLIQKMREEANSTDETQAREQPLAEKNDEITCTVENVQMEKPEMKDSKELEFGMALTEGLDNESCSASDTEDNVPNYNNDFVALSLCGTDEPTQAEFHEHLLTYTTLCESPELFCSSKLVVRIDNKYYAYPVATAVIMTIITYKQLLPQNALDRLKQFYKNERKNKNKVVFSSPTESDTEGIETKRSWWRWKSKSPTPRKDEQSTDNEKIIEQQENISNDKDKDEEKEKEQRQSELKNSQKQTSVSSSENAEMEQKKTFKLPSSIIKKLNLKTGKNSMEFSVTTAFQGTTRCQCSLYRWKYNDQIIVSDIDGTITKSDVLGHLLPMVGKDWSQLGVAQLFTKINDNGYKILYVSSRAIGQAKNTRDYLNWVRQDNTRLPEGPILISPTSMLNTLHRELIERKPELFKIACLEDISALFPHKNPFYAGYGNRINDVIAYCHVGIPKARIFTINYRGEIKFEQMPSFRSSYLNMIDIVDHIFPPITANDCDTMEYASCNFWRNPIEELPSDIAELYIESPTSKSGFRLRFS